MGSDMIFAGSFLWSLINNLNINIVISMSCVVYRVWPSHQYPVYPRPGKSKKTFKINMQSDAIILYRPGTSVAIQTMLGA